MKKFAILAALSLLAGAAHAGAVYPETVMKKQTYASKTRAEVVAEVEAARAQGTLPLGEATVYNDAPAARAVAKSRSQVAAEVDAARARGQLALGEIVPISAFN